MTAPRIAVLALTMALSPAVATADWLVMPLLGLTFGADTNILDLEDATGLTNISYGASVKLLSDGGIGVEVDFNFVPDFFQRDGSELVLSSHVVTLMGNIVVATPLKLTGQSLRPFASGGFGLVRVKGEDVLNLFPIDRNLGGFNIGGGAIGMLSERTGVRFDLRYYKTVNSSDQSDPVAFGGPRLSFWRASVALVLRY
jgi:hypothetical protein